MSVITSFDIMTNSTGGYKLHIKNDGTDYAGLWASFRAGTLERLTRIRGTATVDVYKTTAFGRDFIIKIDRGYPHHIDSKLWRILQGPFYSHKMRAINRSVRNGCRLTPEFLMVAEKEGGLICRESAVIMEFLHGRALTGKNEVIARQQEVIDLLQELHRYGLPLCDLNPGNFFITGAGLKAIDLSGRGSSWTGIAKDAYLLKKLYGLELPQKSFLRKLAVGYVSVLFKLRYAIRDLKGKNKTKRDLVKAN